MKRHHFLSNGGTFLTPLKYDYALENQSNVIKTTLFEKEEIQFPDVLLNQQNNNQTEIKNYPVIYYTDKTKLDYKNNYINKKS